MPPAAPARSPACDGCPAPAQIAALEARIDALNDNLVRVEKASHDGHSATATTLGQIAVSIARLEEQGRAAKEAAEKAAESAWTPSKLAAALAAVASLAGALGYGAPRVVEAASAPTPPAAAP